MTDSANTSLPKVDLATKEWVSREYIDTERRIEKAFHEQTRFLNIRLDAMNEKIDSQTKWLVGLILTMTLAILVAVLFK